MAEAAKSTEPVPYASACFVRSSAIDVRKCMHVHYLYSGSVHCVNQLGGL